MSVLITCQSLSKSYSARRLFEGITLSINDSDRIGLIGPNGSGKSTLLKILSGLVEPDEGEVVTRKFLHTAYVAQDNEYEQGLTLTQVLDRSLDTLQLDATERKTRVGVQLTKMGFDDPQAPAACLSGGWKKRLAIAAELVKEPDFLLLDEPTNHLDLDGVLWLEELLSGSSFPFIIVSHDRAFLETLTNKTIELNPKYRDGFLSVEGPYSSFLQAYDNAMAAQVNERQALESRARREIAWLQRGARARQTKSQHRIREAGKLMDQLDEARSRATQRTADIDFSASGRRTRELLALSGISKSIGDRRLFREVDLILHPGMKLGVVGANGCGKTTLLRIIAGQLQPDSGSIKPAPDLKVVWFDQNREQLDKSTSLKEALCADGDSVIYRGKALHVASWSRRFLFHPDQLPMPVSRLSGGEQARILLARLMLEPADILILDEPTNDLDIPTLTVLEESLQEFPGAVVLVTHDRLLLNNIANHLLALDGKGGSRHLADYSQYEAYKASLAPIQGGPEKPQQSKLRNDSQPTSDLTDDSRPLSTGEKKELAQMEQRISEAESRVVAIKTRMEDPEIARDHLKLAELMNELRKAELEVDNLYERWSNLESRHGVGQA